MGRLLARTVTAASLGLLSILLLSSPAVAQAPQPPAKDISFDFSFFEFPAGATRVTFYVLVGIIIMFAGTLIGLIVFRGHPDNGSGFSRSGS
jgi:hypothetical protein